MSVLSQDFDSETLRAQASMAVAACLKLKVDAAEVHLNASDGVSLSVRQGQLQELETMRENAISITVYKNQASASASSGDLSAQGIENACARACSLVNFTQADAAQGLADAKWMAQTVPDLDLLHPWQIDIATAIAKTTACEASALAYHGISNSEGAELHSHQSQSVYANSHGFCGAYKSARHSLSCQVMAGEGAMVRDYWYGTARNPNRLPRPEDIGSKAAKRALARRNPRQIKTQKTAVLYAPEVAGSLIGHFLQAISGAPLYNQASFLLDSVGQAVFNPIIQMRCNPLLLGGIGSAPFDGEGMRTFAHDLVIDGKLQHYLLNSYAARRLNLPLEGNSGGVRNLTVAPTVNQNLDAMIAQMQRGLVVTELMGSSVNLLTGDYSRGAAGFWVENGQIAHPVAEVTVAGNLKEMYQHIVAVGVDEVAQGNIVCGGILLDALTVAGN